MRSLPVSDTVTTERRGDATVVTLNRPAVLNALNRQALVDLSSIMAAARADPSVLGVILTGAGDRAFALEAARFGQPEVTLGFIPGYGGSQRLPRLVGKGRAMQMILSGHAIDANEALRIGLVNEVVAADGLLARADAVLASMTANAPVAVRLAMAAVNGGLETSLANGCALEAALFGLCAATADRAEGTSAFLGKRKPVFQGR